MSVVLVKIGGSLAVDEKALESFCQAIASLHRSGLKIVLVHGGGKDINRNLALLEEKPKFINGLRVTDAKVLDMVEMTLSGHVNKKLVRLLQKQNVKAVGVSGCDAHTIVASKKIATPDLGFVGEASSSDGSLVRYLLEGGFVPVISPISADSEGQAFNINADEAASAVAVALQVDKLLFVSDVPGVLQDGEVIPALNKTKIEELIATDVISGGMIPKVQSCLDGLTQGIGEVHILGFTSPQNFINHLLKGETNGTVIA